jgi:CubicO group peptidase (beta-lactamase class C family)
MTHSSGLPDIEDFKDFDIPIPYSADEFLSHVKQLQLPRFPKDQYRYSSIGFILLSGIVEKVSDTNFCDFINQEIFKPLEMNATGCIDPLNLAKLSTLGYQNKGQNQIEKVPFTFETFSEGSGNLYSNLKDLMIWDESIRSKKLLSNSSYQKWYTGYLQVQETNEYEDKGDWLGYGWFLRFDNKELVKAYHLGGVTGYKASITRFPEKQIFIVTLSNIINEHSNIVRMEFPKLVYKMEIQ